MLLLKIFLNIHPARSVLASSISTIRALCWFCSPESVSQDVLLRAIQRWNLSKISNHFSRTIDKLIQNNAFITLFRSFSISHNYKTWPKNTIPHNSTEFEWLCEGHITSNTVSTSLVPIGNYNTLLTCAGDVPFGH